MKKYMLLLMLCIFSDLGGSMLYNFLKESGSELREQRGPRTMMSRVLPVPGAWLCAAVAVSLSLLSSQWLGWARGRGWTMMTHPAPAPAQQPGEETGERRKNRFKFDSKLAISDETGGWQLTTNTWSRSVTILGIFVARCQYSNGFSSSSVNKNRQAKLWWVSMS